MKSSPLSRGSRHRHPSTSSNTSGISKQAEDEGRPEIANTAPEEMFDINARTEEPNIIAILSMNGYRDTRKWDSMTKKIKNRVVAHRRSPNAEVEHFPSIEDEMNDTMVVERERTMLSVAEQLKAHIQLNVRVDDIKTFQPVTLKDVQPFNQPDIQSNFCFKCWMLVASAPVGLSCQYCPVIAHRHCVDEIQVQAKANLRALRQKHALELNALVGSSSFSEFDSGVSSVAISPRGEYSLDAMTSEELNMLWVCPFCIEILHDHNDFKENQEVKAREMVKLRKQSISMTATAKMFIARKHWIARVKNSIKIQRFVRARSTMYVLRNELRATKSVLRVIIHEVALRIATSVSIYCTSLVRWPVIFTCLL